MFEIALLFSGLALHGSLKGRSQFLTADAAQVQQAASHFLPSPNAVRPIENRMEIPVQRGPVVLLRDEPGGRLPDSCNRLATLQKRNLMSARRFECTVQNIQTVSTRPVVILRIRCGSPAILGQRLLQSREQTSGSGHSKPQVPVTGCLQRLVVTTHSQQRGLTNQH